MRRSMVGEPLSFEVMHHIHRCGASLSRDDIYNSIQSCNSISSAQRLHSLLIASRHATLSPLADPLIRLFGASHRLLVANVLFCQSQQATGFTWQAILSAHSTAGEHLRTLHLYQKMEQEYSLSPSKQVLTSILKSCGVVGLCCEGMLIHHKVIRDSLEEAGVYVGSSLIQMYAKCCCLLEAQKVFDDLQYRNEVTWNALIAGYAQNGHDLCAMHLFHKMQQSGLKPGKVTFLCLLKLCLSNSKALSLGMRLHHLLIDAGLELNEAIGTALMGMYAQCGSIKEASTIFLKIPNKNDVTWGVMISAYAQHGLGNLAIEVFEEMSKMGCGSDEILLSRVLKGCADIRSLDRGMEIHNQIIAHGLDADVVLGTALINMYLKCKDLASAQHVFNVLPSTNVVTWSSMLFGYTEHGQASHVLHLFEEMQKQGEQPDPIAFLCILQACCISPPKHMIDGMIIHSYMVETELETNPRIINGLIDMYSQCGSTKDTQKVLSMLPFQGVDALSKNISAYIHLGQDEMVLQYCRKMKSAEMKPSVDTISLMLKSCAMLGVRSIGKMIHEEIIQRHYGLDLVFGNALLNMYAKCGAVEEAFQVFDEMSVKDIMSWSTIISGYTQCGHGNHALHLFQKMQDDGFEPDKYVFSSALKACGTVGSIELGKIMHDQFLRSELAIDSVAGNIMVDMYAKCGSLQDACKMFRSLPEPTEVSWNSIIAACANYGMHQYVGSYLLDMQQHGLKPSAATYNCILTACSRVGLVEAGRNFFKLMIEYDNVAPSRENFNCILDIIGRAGYLREAKEFLRIVPVLPSVTSLTSLLTACKIHNNFLVGLECYEETLAG